MTWKIETSTERVIATFQGHLDAEALAPGPVEVVWVVSEMTGYDPAARLSWQEAIWPNRRNIRSLVVVGADTLIKVGAVMLAVFIGAPWRLVDTVGDLDRAAA